MSKKRSYITIINDFWTQYAQEPLSAPAATVYFYLLNRINRNRWLPVLISDRELAEALTVSRGHLPGYKREITAAGLLLIEEVGKGRTRRTVYGLPGEMAPKEATNGTQKGQKNGTKKSQLNNVVAPKEATNGTQKGQLGQNTPYNISNKTYIRHSTTTMSLDVADVEPQEVKAVEIYNPEETEAEKLERRRKKAADQGEEILKAFFAESQSLTISDLCRINKKTVAELYEIAQAVIRDWVQDGKTHDTWRGDFDIGEGVKHLRFTIPKKAAAIARGEVVPKTRDQKRNDLMAASLANLQRIISGQGAAPAEEKPF